MAAHQEENKEAHRGVLTSDKGKKNRLKWKRKKRERKRYKIMHQSRAKKQKTKNTFIFTTVVTAYIISIFLCVGSWGHIEKENKRGGKKRKFKNHRFAKKKKSEEREILPSKRKKKKKSYKKLNAVTSESPKHETRRCKTHVNIKMSRRTNSKC